MDCMESNCDKPDFTNHGTLLLCLILSKCSSTKKIAFGNKYYRVMKRKLSFLDMMVYRRLAQENWGFPPKEHSANIKTWRSCNDLGRGSSRRTSQLIAIRGIMKSEDCIRILDENLRLSVQNLDLGQWFTFQPDNDPKYTSVSEKEEYSSVMAFNEFWLESHWKLLVRIESSNKSSVTKKFRN